MELAGSTLRGHPGEVRAGFHRLATRILGESRGLPPDKLAALLLPMVRRAVRTERGPAALVGWLRQRPGAPRAGHRSEGAERLLTEDLVRALVDTAGTPADTLDDSH